MVFFRKHVPSCMLPVVIFAFQFFCPVESGIRLSKSVGYYEILSYPPEPVHEQHHRVKRSQQPEVETVEIDFNSHGKDFRLRLRRDTTTFTDSYRQRTSADEEDATIDLTHLYSGYLKDVPGSTVYGSVWDGVFEGNIETPEDGTYFIERATKHWNKDSRIFFLDNADVDENAATLELRSDGVGAAEESFPMRDKFHSVIYHEDQVSSVPLGKNDGKKFGSCALNDDTVENWMHEVERSVEIDQPVEVSKSSISSNALDLNLKRIKRSPQSSASRQYSTNGNNRRTSYPSQQRSGNNGSGVGSGNGSGTCEMFIRTDPMLYKYFHKTEGIPEDRVQEEIASLVQQLIKAVSNIYSNTKFNMGRYNHSGITFAVQRLRVDNYTKDCVEDRRGSAKPKNIFCSPSIDVTNFLTFFSHENHDAFCLAFMLTCRDFSDGTLGLAWVASPSRGNKGGVCERRGRITGHDQELSLNTGVVTFLNYNSKVTIKVSQLTLAHEIGHNFGAASVFLRTRVIIRCESKHLSHFSQHDPDSMRQCIPGPEDGGNYIMYRHATKGTSANNRRFSPCSVRNISLVLDAIYQSTQVDNGKYYCFKASNLTFCGNRMVEEHEECDCGFDDHECRDDKCCHPRIGSDGKQHKLACKLVHGPDSCSPSQGPCCRGSECSVIKLQEEVECAKESECKERSKCDGLSPKCPRASSKQELTECNHRTQVCMNGECNGAYCMKWNLQECFLTSSKVQDKRKLCELACQLKGRPETCTSTSRLYAAIAGRDIDLSTNEVQVDNIAPELLEQFTKSLNFNATEPLRTIHLMPGSACDNYQGYCDVFQKCRAVDEEGPLLRIKRLFFGKETLKTIQEWITERWWAVVLIAVGLIVTMAGLIKCCAVHTPSSNPKRPRARRLQDTFYYVPMTTARRVGSAASSTLRRVRHHHHHHHPVQQVRVPGYAAPNVHLELMPGGGRRGRNGRGAAMSDAEAEISLAPPSSASSQPPRGRGRREVGNGGGGMLVAIPPPAAGLPKAGKRGSRPSNREFSLVQGPSQGKPVKGRKK
ncbi:unnamed protein product [Notodromas monacha]|uniref:ADAM10 endopeptidase n=1 Tax=Notodromas monacha TaxID=399045 RepID=A0A7R9BU81_9CRUS|nr:unnamed protein product [Notodromas monacha]CAG0921849.1 unnamed protein product [Notodromas monacha]